MTSNSSDLEDEVNYDLDTSIVVNDQDVTFFNQVDNPLTRADCTIVNDFIVKEFGSLTVAALMCGAAGEYPQAFINLDRDAEKATTISSSLGRLRDKLETLKPALYFPAGGTYFIPGKLSGLFKYVAQPSADQISALVKEHHISTRVCFAERGATMTVTSKPSGADVSMSNGVRRYRHRWETASRLTAMTCICTRPTTPPFQTGRRSSPYLISRESTGDVSSSRRRSPSRRTSCLCCTRFVAGRELSAQS